MDTTEITYALKGNKCTRKWFKGCFAADKLPKTFKKPALFIVNTQEAKFSGEHWISIYISEKGHCEYFDAFGQQPSVLHHIKFIKKHCTSCVYSNNQIQGPFSSKCGQFSCSFLLYKSRHRTIKSFLNVFSQTDLWLNDTIVNEMFNVNFNPNSFKGDSIYKIKCNQIG